MISVTQFGVKSRCGAQERVTGKWEFLKQIKDASARNSNIVCALQKYRLKMSQLAGDREHLSGR
jgi:hypothetical protein